MVSGLQGVVREPVDEDSEFGDAVAHVDSVVATYAEKITAL